MVIGHITESKKDEDKPWKDTLLELTKHSAYPILKTDCFGHFAKTFYTFPIGGEATINTTKKVFAFEP
jgi:muramoyltetrapeptide carboxypeptidase LdcA involved in peptidoglycan recycling